VLGTEMDSPRGRIYQMLQVDAGRLALGDSFVTHIDRCLGCLNCQTACPSGVQYGSLLERTRSQIEENYQRPWLQRKLREHFYSRVLPSFSKLARSAKLVRFYQRSGLQNIARTSGLLKLLGVEEIDALSPRIESDFSFRDLGRTYPAEGVRRGRVALLIGCISSVAFAELNRATIRVLNKNGIEVCIPQEQSCCGALHAHAGLLDMARAQARKNIDAMLRPEIDAIVSNAAGCGATMKEYADLLEHDPQYAERAKQFVAKARDVTEYLAAVGLTEPKRRLKSRVTYSDPCHLAHAQGVRKQPRELLKAIGVELVEMPRADSCCGSAGVYNVVQNEISMKVLDEKMEYVSMVEPEIVVTANVGCMLQLAAGAKRKGLKTKVNHVIELLDQAY
jgi:glycolate oxidase iron-sulfur subunit